MQIKLDRVLGAIRFEIHIAEIAPAGGHVGLEPQRGAVTLRGHIEVATHHAGIAELEMQFRGGLGAGLLKRIDFGFREATSERDDRLIDPAGGQVARSTAQR